MNFTQREMLLVPITVVVALFGLSYFFGKAKLDEWKEMGNEIELQEAKLEKMQRIYDRRGPLRAKLEKLMKNLPSFPENKNVAADTLIQIQRMVKQAGLSLKSIAPKEEEKIGSLGLYELGISCNWQGTLESLVNFLFEVQSANAALDVDNLRIQILSSRNPDKLKGTFIIDSAYTRASNAEETK